MKPFRSNKILGLAIGERSLLAAEVLASERPRVRRVARFDYPEGLSLAQPQALGAALDRFLREHTFTARAVVAGLPARWLLVKSKEVPPADEATTSRMLRLQAETEFSSELKDLVYDYIPADGPAGGAARPVLLLATQRQYIAAVQALCQGARLRLESIMPQATALSRANEPALDRAWILHLHADSAELAAQSGGAPLAIRHLRSSATGPQFAGELRRAIASVTTPQRPGELLVWNDEPIDSSSLTSQLGLPLRIGKLSELGVDLHLNGTAPADPQTPMGQYAPAVALALAGLNDRPTINFLRSRLAAPKVHRVPRWAIIAAAALLVLVVGVVYAWRELQQQEAQLTALQTRLDGMKGEIKTAESFVSMVNFAQQWHGGEARYLLCLRDLTLAIPNDGRTYATNLVVRDPATTAAPPRSAGAAKTPEVRTLAGQLYGKAHDQQAVQVLIDRLKHAKGFGDVKLGGTQNAARNGEVAFSITFSYQPQATPAPPAKAPAPAVAHKPSTNPTGRQP